jgi:FK506-binding protein 4/5
VRVTLKAFEEKTDVSKDGGVVKWLMEEGEGYKLPADLTSVWIRYTMRRADADAVLYDTKRLDPSMHGTAPAPASPAEEGNEGKEEKEGEDDLVGCAHYVLDEDAFVPAGLELAVRAMKKGEKARVLVQPKYAFGEKGCAEWGVPVSTGSP